jgi:hypothetical protein
MCGGTREVLTNAASRVAKLLMWLKVSLPWTSDEWIHSQPWDPPDNRPSRPWMWYPDRVLAIVLAMNFISLSRPRLSAAAPRPDAGPRSSRAELSTAITSRVPVTHRALHIPRPVFPHARRFLMALRPVRVHHQDRSEMRVDPAT